MSMFLITEVSRTRVSIFHAERIQQWFKTVGCRQTGPSTYDRWRERTLLHAHGSDAVSLAVLLQAQLLFMQVHRGWINSSAF